MQVKFEPTASRRRYTGIGAIAALHVSLGYALVSGLAPQMVDAIKKPMEAVLIQEVKLPPPPPPPKTIQPAKVPTQTPQVEAPPPPFVPPSEVSRPPADAPAIESSTAPPQQLPVIAPPAPPAPTPTKSDIALACPIQVAPQMPEKAVRDGLSGVVRAQATIRGGGVSDVAILSGPRVFHAAVRAAMEKYRCSATDGTVAVQDFTFKVE